MKKMFGRILPVLVIMSLFLGACAASNPPLSIPVTGASATPEPSVTPVTSATLVAPQSDDVWDRIVANQKIVVGTSWDYPPFSSVDPNFKVVGFDIALIEEVGRRLNLPVEIQNFAFEGLPGALQINQIDLAVAAISITPERSALMSFSPIYYVNQTAVLARSDSGINTITNFNQLAGYRVGVQRGTTYENMAQTLLVDTGLMKSEKLLSYRQADEAVRDLLEKRVDVVVLGQATASYYATQQDLHTVGDKFDEQNLAIAMRPGTPRLKAEIDRVMGDMLTDGTILGLIQQYIETDANGVLPTITPPTLSTATPFPLVSTVTPPACWDGMKFVADVTFGDNNMKNPPFIKPGDGFIKTWRVQNTGTCTWTPSYKLAFAYGNVAAAQMNGQPINVPANVLPGQTIDLSVNLVAPLTALTYQGFWQMQNASGRLFGQTIWVGITTLTGQAGTVATVQPSGDFCAVTIAAPLNAITVNSNFDAVWTVKNISGKDWASDSVDYKFVSGTKMREKDIYDFTETIKDGASGNIVVDMIAPAAPGSYDTKWAIVAGTNTLCILTMNVTVVAK
ncbi:MAG: transporter substrate-binding domain-containing protein [Chloroflexota bacterium]